MPRIKMPKNSPSLDMTPMVDLAFLLVTFFMLIAQFRAEEAVAVEIPSSGSKIKTEDSDVIMILVDKQDKIYFTLTGQQQRIDILEKMADKYKVNFSEEQKKRFSNMASFGVSMKNLPAYINASSTEQKKMTAGSQGVPSDSLSCELCDWIRFSRLDPVARKFDVAIKGDQNTNYTAIKKVIGYLQDDNIGAVNKFKLVTNLETGE